MTGFLLKVAAADRLSLSLSSEYRRLSSFHHKALIARASAVAARLRRRRSHKSSSPPVTPLRKRRAALHGGHPLTLPVHRILQRRLEMASHAELRRRSSTADKTLMDPGIPASITAGTAASSSSSSTSTMTTATTISASPPSASESQMPTASSGVESIVESLPSSSSIEPSADVGAMAPPPRPVSEDLNTPTRGSRSTSSASRHVNRLSLTIPIAPPTPEPSRPTPTSAVPWHPIPHAPVETLIAENPSHPSEFIIAIAAQERRVLELREELTRAEHDLSSLKRQWKLQEASHRRKERRAANSARPTPAATGEVKASVQQNSEMERKKLLLQSQAMTPTAGRRGRIMRGGHTRTLSLLSPPKPAAASFSVLDETEEPVGLPRPPLERRATELSDPPLSRTASSTTSWQPRMAQSGSGMGLVEDFKWGIRAFVEDIRQITVGEEPVKRSSHTRAVSSLTARDLSSVDEDTVRSGSSMGKPKASALFESPRSIPAEGPRTRENARDSSQKAKQKHFSWTPLGLDAVDDNDWSNWESPTSAKSVRWSGSTVSNGGVEDIPEDGEMPLKNTRPRSMELPLFPPKLEEILPSVVNSLSPSNLKKTANHFMEGWEKSLAAPSPSNKENTS